MNTKQLLGSDHSKNNKILADNNLKLASHDFLNPPSRSLNDLQRCLFF